MENNTRISQQELADGLFAMCRSLPVIDYHNHLSAQALCENKPYDNVADLLVGSDHYKWRAMRGAGVEERLITGEASDQERFFAWYDTMLRLVGSPLYVWSAMELHSLFKVDIPLVSSNAQAVYDACQQAIRAGITPRGVLAHFDVRALCTVEDPFDSLQFHMRLAAESNALQVLPIFRPDKLLNVDKPAWLPALKQLEASEGIVINSLSSLKSALLHALERFALQGCVTADHGFEEFDFEADYDVADAEAAVERALSGKMPAKNQTSALRSYLLECLAEHYYEKGWVMQLHFGAFRDTNTRLLERLGHDAGGDCIGVPLDVRRLAALLDNLERGGHLPKTILFPLNRSDWRAVTALSASFTRENVPCNVQLGAAWWFNDHERGIRAQLDVLAEQSLLHGFVGMLTDSRSTGAFVRHEYFCKILCDWVAERFVHDGWQDTQVAYTLVRDICYNNVRRFFDLPRDVAPADGGQNLRENVR